MSEDCHYNILTRYSDVLEKMGPDSTEQEILDALAVRDALQTTLADKEGTKHFGTLLSEANALDQRLRGLGDLIAAKLDLPSLRIGRRPDKEAWWWQFEPAKIVSRWDRFDWLWNSIMAGALALTASFMMQIFQALSVGGLSWGETFATIAQGGGLALVGSGALTDSGNKRVTQILSKLGIKGIYMAETLCAIALIMLAIVYTTHNRLPDYFYEKGEKYYEKSDLTDAAFKFQQGLQIAPDNSKFNLELGRVYESMGNLDAALAQYKIAAETGDPDGLNNLGRVLLFWVDPLLQKRKLVLAESYLRMALQRAKTDEFKKMSAVNKDHDLPELLYQTHRNLGWALLEQKKYKKAEPYLRHAVEWDKKITRDQIGGGMGYCLLSETYRHMGQPTLADENWQECLTKARPETVFEYKWFMDIQQGNAADRIFTSSIVGGVTEDEFKKFLTSKPAAPQKRAASDEVPETKEEKK
ncbi:MAG: tetratricopeptide repeat protein [Candidatus Electrothrix communis]|nr:MAG: tetratricopeptide repeat protein [Candidatus Electrothrix communis]